jgi:uncharacterized RDD family membrane protein YckC
MGVIKAGDRGGQMSAWYYAVGQDQIGPVTDEDLHRLIRDGIVGRDTLIWRVGLEAWTAVANVDEFSEVSAHVPPPLPSLLPANTSIAKPPVERANPIPNPNLTRPWPRFWARLIDNTLLMPIVGFLIALAAAYFRPSLYLAMMSLNEGVLGLIVLPVVSLVLALLMAVFGTTLGKFILGVRVRNLTEMSALPFHLQRELKVWLAGLALGIPIVALFTQVHQYKLVAAGKPAGYDEGLAIVEGRASAGRAVTAAIVCVALFSGVLYLQTTGRQATSDVVLTKTWTNPVSSKDAQLAKTWEAEELPTKGGRLFHFTSNTLLAEALFGYEDVTIEGIDNAAYAKAIQSAIKDAVEITSDWTPVTVRGVPALRAVGKSKTVAGATVEVTVALIGRNAWRTIVFASGRPIDQLPGKDNFVDATFATVN